MSDDSATRLVQADTGFQLTPREGDVPAPRGSDIGDPSQWAGILRRNLWLVAACVILTVSATMFVTARLTRVYEATASLRIEPQATNLSATSLSVLEPLLGTSSDINTEMEVLHSRTLTDAIVDSLRLALRLESPARVARAALLTNVRIDPAVQDGHYRLAFDRRGRVRVTERDSATLLATVEPGTRVSVGGTSFDLTAAAREAGTIDLRVFSRDEATDALLADLAVERPVREANIVTIRYRSSEPELARDVPNLLAASLIAQRQSIRQSAGRSTEKFLREQLDRLSMQLRVAEDALRNFRERERIVDLGEEGRTGVGTLARVQAQWSELETERSSLAKLLAQVNAAARRADPTAPSPYRDLLAFPSLLRNQAATQLLSSLALVEDRRTELLARRSLQDPDVKLLTARVKELEDQLHSLTTTYLNSLTSQEATLDSTLRSSTEDLKRFPERELEFARLSRQKKLLEDLFTLLQTRLKEAEIGAAAEDASIRLVDAARLPRMPISPRPVINAALASLAGLIFGLAVALGRVYTDRSIHSRREVRAATGLAVVGLIPRVRPRRSWSMRLRRAFGMPALRGTGHGAGERGTIRLPLGESGHRQHLVAENESWSVALEAFNRLEGTLLSLCREGRSATLVLTSPLPSDGKTTVATNLALVASQHGRRVLLLDADLRRGVVNEVFGRARTPGLSEVLRGTNQIADAVREIKVDGPGAMHYVTSGARATDPAQLLATPRTRELLEAARAAYDLVILDTPPVNAVADAVTLASLSDGVLLVARAGVTTDAALTTALDHLAQARAPVLGIVLNDIDYRRDASYDSEYRHFDRYVAYYREAPTPVAS